MQQGIFDLLLAGEGREDGDFLREGRRACDNLFNLQKGLSWNLRCGSTVEEWLGERKHSGQGPGSEPLGPAALSLTLSLSLTFFCFWFPACYPNTRPGQAAAQWFGAFRLTALGSGPTPGWLG